MIGISVGLSVGQPTVLVSSVRDFNMAVLWGTINVINVKLCMIVLHSELYLFMNTTFSGLDHISVWSSQKCQTFLTKKFMFLSA